MKPTGLHHPGGCRTDPHNFTCFDTIYTLAVDVSRSHYVTPPLLGLVRSHSGHRGKGPLDVRGDYCALR